ncbi:GNAT family N-acetyltransferase [Blastococcus deserti]|uniref:GNAT family N-acetyltransferase n=1 Tax=Blastococcus deserti TaxID=2259033 RepID=A0ABW4X6U7_9ACTN
MPDPVPLRKLEPADRFLLRTATWLNLNRCGERFTFAQMDADRHLAAYHRFAPDDGDYGLVSTAGEEPTGVVWVRFFSADVPGYGFVRAGVPELSVCVLPGYRGAGVGGRLVAAAVVEARRRSLGALSLSVEEGNPARRLYERLGFAPVAGARHPGTLALDLGPAVAPPRA